MSDFDQKEYNSVVLAALLHDVGKMIHRRKPGYEGSHSVAAATFMADNRSKLDNPRLYHLDAVIFLVRNHDRDKEDNLLESPLLAGKLDKEKRHLIRLLKIIGDADSYSCAERQEVDVDKRKKDRRVAPLDSIFSYINIDVSRIDEGDILQHDYIPFSSSKSFPAEIVSIRDESIARHVEAFLAEVPHFNKCKTFQNVLIIWLNLLGKYTWSVPSDTRYRTSDVSLYDHLRSAAAIAACLYKRHIDDINSGKARLDRQEEILFVGGDFSGIQDYIFHVISGVGSGAAKRLRARSLFVSIFSETVVHKIFHQLDLPLVCNIFSAGGKFLIIAPNNKETVETLRKLKREVEDHIHKSHFSQFSYLMDWFEVGTYKEDFKILNFCKVADKMFHKLAGLKHKKAYEVLLSAEGNAWNQYSFMEHDLYKSYIGSRDCRYCGRGPAVMADPESGEKDSCRRCYIDRHVIGKKLPKTNFIAYGIADSDKIDEDKRISLLGYTNKNGSSDGKVYFFELLKSYKEDKDYYQIQRIGHEGDDSAEGAQAKYLVRYIANYVPLDEEGNIEEFENLAPDMLGVLKADADNMGLLFSKGFANPGRLERYSEEVDRKSVSRYLTMSRMLDLFFCGWLKETLKKGLTEKVITDLLMLEGIDHDRFSNYLRSGAIDFTRIYTVYSAGDDLVLVGPWETMIIFAIYLNQQFRKYTANNEWFTLSAGLTFVKPKFPISSAIKQADELMNKAKADGKDRCTFFGTTAQWEKMANLADFFLYLNSKLEKRDTTINSSFLYRLLEYQRNAVAFIEDRKTEGLRYLSNLSYDLGRNIFRWEKDGTIEGDMADTLRLQELIGERPDRNALIYNLKIPLYWALYRNRVNL
jgi:CRISPR-associated protein Csm1